MSGIISQPCLFFRGPLPTFDTAGRELVDLFTDRILYNHLSLLGRRVVYGSCFPTSPLKILTSYLFVLRLSSVSAVCCIISLRCTIYICESKPDLASFVGGGDKRASWFLFWGVKCLRH